MPDTPDDLADQVDQLVAENMMDLAAGFLGVAELLSHYEGDGERNMACVMLQISEVICGVFEDYDDDEIGECEGEA